MHENFVPCSSISFLGQIFAGYYFFFGSQKLSVLFILYGKKSSIKLSGQTVARQQHGKIFDAVLKRCHSKYSKARRILFIHCYSVSRIPNRFFKHLYYGRFLLRIRSRIVLLEFLFILTFFTIYDCVFLFYSKKEIKSFSKLSILLQP